MLPQELRNRIALDADDVTVAVVLMVDQVTFLSIIGPRRNRFIDQLEAFMRSADALWNGMQYVETLDTHVHGAGGWTVLPADRELFTKKVTDVVKISYRAGERHRDDHENSVIAQKEYNLRFELPPVTYTAHTESRVCTGTLVLWYAKRMSHAPRVQIFNT